MHVTSDADLVTTAVSGNRQAAADLIERHASVVYAICLGLLADPDRAQDAAQDALLKALERLESLREPAAFRAWLVAIARNQCRDFWKRTRRRQQLLDQEMGLAVSTDAVPGMGMGMGTIIVDAGDATEADLQIALARLPENHRLPLLLYYFDGLDSARVAEALGISRSGAGARICRARRALREILEASHD